MDKSENIIGSCTMQDELEKMKKESKKSQRKMLALSFAAPFALMLLVYIVIGVWPISTNSVLVLDLNGQYVYFFQSLHNLIYKGTSLLYSWSTSMGSEFMGIYSYYLASPLSWLVALLPSGCIVEGLLFLILTKCGISGATMSYYLHKTHPTKPLNCIIFGTLYAMCGYALNYLHNTMWIDALMWLPLVTLGLEKLISERKFLLFTLMLALTIISNYYIGFMVCLYVFFYFFYYHISHSSLPGYNLYGEKAHFFRSLLRVGLFSVIAVAISAIIILPAQYSLTFGKNTFTDPTYEFTTKFNIIDFLFKLFPGATDTVRREGLPYVYSGTIALLMLPAFFAAKKVSVREKVGAGLILSLFYIFFNISAFDLLWHGGQVPNWLNYRYSFMFSFLLIVFAYRGFQYLENTSFKFILGTGGILGIILIMIQQQNYGTRYKYTTEYWYDYNILCVFFSFLMIGVIITALYVYKRDMLKKSGIILLVCCVFFETYAVGVMHHYTLAIDVGYSSRASYLNFIDRASTASDYVQDMDKTFYRMEKTFHRQPTDNMALNMRGISNSTSTMNKNTLKLLNELGYVSKSYWSEYIGGNPVADSLLGIRYIIDDDQSNGKFYKQIFSDSDKDVYAFFNRYALSLAFAVNDDVLNMDYDSYKSPFELYNDLVTSMLGKDQRVELFKPIDITSTTSSGVTVGYVNGNNSYTAIGGKTPVNAASEDNDPEYNATVTYKFTAPTNDTVYLFIPTDYPREAALSINGEDNGTILGNKSDCIVELGDLGEGSQNTLTLTLKDDKLYTDSGSDYIYYLDMKVFKEAFSKLAENQFIITDNYSESNIGGRITVTGDNTVLYTTIPYDKGWKVTIDGKEVEPITYTSSEVNEETGEVTEKVMPYADSLIAVKIDSGFHNVRFRYMPQCITLGLLISGGGIFTLALITVVWLLVRRKHRKSRGNIEDSIRDSAMIADSIENLPKAEAEGDSVIPDPCDENKKPTLTTLTEESDESQNSDTAGIDEEDFDSSDLISDIIDNYEKPGKSDVLRKPDNNSKISADIISDLINNTQNEDKKDSPDKKEKSGSQENLKNISDSEQNKANNNPKE